MEKGRRTVLLRAIAVLVAGGLIAGMSLAGPAMGAKTFTKSKAKKLFYTKGGADDRFINVGELAGTTVAYGHVKFDDASVDATRSKNITAFKGTTGYYCVNASVPYKNVQVTLDTTGGYTYSVASGDPFTSCGTFPSDVAVIVGSPNDSSFFIEFIA
jgi:hypothetical protein